MVKCCGNVDFEEMDTECSTGKDHGFWVLWGIFREYIKQNIIMVVLRKANSLSAVTCRLIKKSIMYQGEKLNQTLIFPKLAT